VTREGLAGFLVHHWISPANAVDVPTRAQVKTDLRCWHLSLCVFLGDAGMVSEENHAEPEPGQWQLRPLYAHVPGR
jgi:hypothetical protein